MNKSLENILTGINNIKLNERSEAVKLLVNIIDENKEDIIDYLGKDKIRERANQILDDCREKKCILTMPDEWLGGDDFIYRLDILRNIIEMYHGETIKIIKDIEREKWISEGKKAVEELLTEEEKVLLNERRSEHLMKVFS